MGAQLWELNRRRREREDLMRRLGVNGESLSSKAALEEASAVGRPAASSSAVTLRGDLERADVSSNADDGEPA